MPRAGNWNGVVHPAKDPCQGELRRRHATGRSDPFHDPDEPEIVIEVVALEPGMVPAPVGLG